MPDIDIDFDDERRGEVIDYVRDKYGEDKVAQIITFRTMKARAAVRDAGRVLGYPYGVPDKVAKQIQEGPDATIDGVAQDEPGPARPTYEAGGDTKRIVDAALALEGLVRGEGVHAAGVVICRDPLHYHTPVKRDTKGESIVTQYEGTLIADLGLLKMDFLGLRTLTVHRQGARGDQGEPRRRDRPRRRSRWTTRTRSRCYQRGRRRRRVPGRVAAACAACCKHAQADRVRRHRRRRGAVPPGPDGLASRTSSTRKHGRTPITYYDDRLKPILEETYGTMVYQEQVMRISMEMAGFSAAKADKLRKAHGQEERARSSTRCKPEFVEGAVERGYDKQARRAGLDRHREVRRVRVQQEPRGRLRAHHATRRRT